MALFSGPLTLRCIVLLFIQLRPSTLLRGISRIAALNGKLKKRPVATLGPGRHGAGVGFVLWRVHPSGGR